MKNKYSLIAIALGILLAIPTLIEGTSVILGKEQAGMIVLFWLVYYNVGMALFSLFVVYAIWKNLSNKLTMTSVVAVGHVLVLFVLVAIYLSSGQVAVKSLLAMTMRSLVWGTIYFFCQKKYLNKLRNLLCYVLWIESFYRNVKIRRHLVEGKSSF